MQDINLKLVPGSYVAAVSGGVDSIALLHMLSRLPASDFSFIVAHFEHGIRQDSDLDRQLVEAQANQYGFPFVFARGQLGSGASEADARQARYAFLHAVRKDHGAQVVITAHHQDDLLETAAINLLRGTGWRGLVSLRSRANVVRPLLEVPKAYLVNYASEQALDWREDSTNQDMSYLRNYVRTKLLPRLSDAEYALLLEQIKRVQSLRGELEAELDRHIRLNSSGVQLDRRWFIYLPHDVSREIMGEWLRRSNVNNLSAKMIDRLVVAAKTYTPGLSTDVDKHCVLRIKKEVLALHYRER